MKIYIVLVKTILHILNNFRMKSVFIISACFLDENLVHYAL